MKANIPPHIEDLTEKIIGSAFRVSNALGHGFLETVYKNALAEDISAHGLSLQTERAFEITYLGKRVGHYIADLVIENIVIVELKAVDKLARAHAAQVLNYLKASQMPVGLLMNFGTPKLELRRILLSIP